MKNLVLFICLLIASSVFADDAIPTNKVYFYHDIGTHHTKNSDEYNEHNDVTVLGYNKFFVGTYDNSYNKRSFMTGYEFYHGLVPLGNYFFLEGETYVGVATGYANTPTISIMNLTPAAVATMDIGARVTLDSDVRFRVNLIPAGQTNILNWGFQFTYLF